MKHVSRRYGDDALEDAVLEQLPDDPDPEEIVAALKEQLSVKMRTSDAFLMATLSMEDWGDIAEIEGAVNMVVNANVPMPIDVQIRRLLFQAAVAQVSQHGFWRSLVTLARARWEVSRW